MKKPYKKMPEIDLGHIMLRTINLTDSKDVFEYGSNHRVTEFLNWGPFVHESEARKTIERIFYPRIKKGLPIGYAIISKNNSKMIGTIDFHSKIKKDNSVEIGFVLHQDYWNQGIMSRCIKEMIELGFNYLNYDLIRIKHLKKNIASQKVIEKAGFKYKKTEIYSLEKRNGILSDDLLIYEYKKEDYHGSQQS
jgi:ribosomal-protein-alanine N-acetyltransferase